ncbi:hypothetical protein CCR75_004952 [Bremia lactucae]|uniref:Uncharacterized protein n=1 Tax=Bremia lactucae TaxID=4779 RepID=A0A976FEJ2_BRELC|nr:hypothetical protein CCR75_004952 [Bremia lactucae]
MHEEVADCNERIQLYQKMAKKGLHENFSAGDFVLWPRVDERLRGNNWAVRSDRGTRVPIYDRACDLFEVHGSRLKLFHNASMSVTAEILELIGNRDIVLRVERIQNHRYNTLTKH